MFEKILIANRGEIAVRILRACHERGVRSAAVYSEVDRDSLHVRMGDKAAARETMRKAGVPVLPGKHCPGDNQKNLLRAANEVGYPLLIKATYGGGGKGMRVVEDPKALIQAWSNARTEAEATCGSGDIYLEAFVPSARHIEIQLLADEHGHVVHCGERECSVQRRHQKLVEESPSAAVTPRIRKRLTAASVRAARKVGTQARGRWSSFWMPKAGSSSSNGAHDENIAFEKTCEIVGARVAEDIRRASLRLYAAAAEYALRRGIIIADTKFEFGLVRGELTLIDEVLTPDSSRFWPADKYAVGRSQPSFDKQYVRDYLNSIGWERKPPAPNLPEKVVQETSAKYREALRLLTGNGTAEKGTPRREIAR